MDALAPLSDLARLVVALAVVIALMGGVAFLLKRIGLAGAVAPRSDTKRLRVLERLPLDARRSLVLIERDQVQHLVILGVTGETVVESHIKATHKKEKQNGAD